MRKGFVPTENYRRLADAQRQVERRGAAEAGLVIVKGPYGVGKSEIVQRWAVDNNAVFVRCMQTWTRRSLVNALADALGLDTRGRNSEVQARVIGRLAVENNRVMVFDEADFLIGKTAALLECVRDITDTTGSAAYLVAMDQFGASLVRHGHIASRVARVVEFQFMSLDDVKTTVEKLCEVQLAPEVVQLLHVQSEGRMRKVLNAISTLEQWAEANGWKRIAAEHVKGRAMCVEFKPGHAAGRRQEAS